MTVLLILFLLVALGIGAAAAVALIGGKAVGRNAQKQNQVVAGTPSNAPAHWFGSHEPEAKLHRRVRDAVAGLKATPSDDPAMAEIVASVEREALTLDDQIVAASNLADRLKPDVLASLTSAVEQFEDITGSLITRASGLDSGNVQSELDALSERLDLLAQARAELDEGPQPGTAYYD